MLLRIFYRYPDMMASSRISAPPILNEIGQKSKSSTFSSRFSNSRTPYSIVIDWEEISRSSKFLDWRMLANVGKVRVVETNGGGGVVALMLESK